MKKFVKWFLFSLLVCGAIALAICYMVIPQETKSAMDIVVGYLNTPLGIAGGTTITIGMVAYIVISYLFKVNREKSKEDYETLVSEYQAKISGFENECNKLKDCEEKLIEQVNDLIEQHNISIEQISEILKLIPNKKVQDKLGELYGKETTND